MVDTDVDDRMPAPTWPTCGHKSSETGSPCIGQRATVASLWCLAHLEPKELDWVLQDLRPGADLSAPGTEIDAKLLERILRAVASKNQPPRFGAVNLAQARFPEPVSFRAVRFDGDAEFGGARFNGDAEFRGARFSGGADFDSANFVRNAGFRGAQFGGAAKFREVHFGSVAGFRSAHFRQNANFLGAWFGGDADFADAQLSNNGDFGRAQFHKNARLSGAQFGGTAQFTGARFQQVVSLGPLTASALILRGAVFTRPVMLEAAAGSVTCIDTTWEAGVTMRLRHATVDLERATFTVPSFVAGADHEFERPDFGLVDERTALNTVQRESRVPGAPWIPVISSLRGADTFNLSVTDVDLSQCRFAGALLLDQLRLEGRCIFDHPPKRLHVGWAWPPVWRWSKRQSLAEERLWRASRPKFSGWAQARSSQPAEVRPERLAALYRQLRKAQEDAKNEPGAADFYYGEMEMRRHARDTSWAERTIVRLYWLLSGYGLRAVRSVAALVILGVIITTAMTGWGLAASAPVTTPSQALIGTVTASLHKPAKIDATLQGLKPQPPQASQRWTSERAQTALEVTVESFAFRSTDQPLTPKGTWITIAARILGPVLLALALLAVRNRVKR